MGEVVTAKWKVGRRYFEPKFPVLDRSTVLRPGKKKVGLHSCGYETKCDLLFNWHTVYVQAGQWEWPWNGARFAWETSGGSRILKRGVPVCD